MGLRADRCADPRGGLEKLSAGVSGLVKKPMDCTVCSKTKVLISCAATMQLICASVLAYAKSRLSHEAAQDMIVL